MKKILFIGLFLLGMLGGATLLISSPFRWFKSGLIQGELESSWFSLKKFNAAYLSGKQVPFKQSLVESEVLFDIHKWRKMHLMNFNLPLPYRHPLIRFIPTMKYHHQYYSEVGYRLNSINNDLLLEVSFLDSINLDYKIDGQKILELPIVKSQLLKNPADNLWHDVFLTKIELNKISYSDLVYMLYLLNWRVKSFPPQTINFYQGPQKNIGIVEVKASHSGQREEMIYFLERGIVHKLILKSSKDSIESNLVRQKFLSELEVYPTSEADGELIYKEFSELDPVGKASDEGLIYLFSSWTHLSGRESLMKEMVYFTEKGLKRYDVLTTLYTYSLDRFKKTFSSKIEDIEGESPSVKLQRLIEREKAFIDYQAKNRPSEVVEEMSEKEVIHQKLEKSKNNQEKDYGRAEE